MTGGVQLRAVAVADTQQEARYRDLKADIGGGGVANREPPATWRCTRGGCPAVEATAPEMCPT